MPKLRSHPLSTHDARRVSIAANCDPRTVDRHVSGRPCTLPAVAIAIDRALVELGLAHLLPSKPDQSEDASPK